jgi:PAS domain S-box-containing protein
MSWVTVVWSMIASACLTLALVHGLVWWWRRSARANLLFALAAVANAFLAAGEVWMMRAETPTEFATAVRWLHVPVWVLILALAGFVQLYLGAGRRWLAWTVGGLRTLSLILNFTTGVNLNYQEITEIQRIPFLGETISIGAGLRNPWMLVGQLSLVLFVVFVVDAALTVWRRGDRRQALVVGGSIVFFASMGTGQAIVALWGIVPMPITASVLYLCIVVAMGFELSHDVLRTAELSDELREREQQISLASEAANLGIWLRDLVRNEIWATDHWRTLFGFAQAERLELEQILQRLHPDDRQAIHHATARAIATDRSYETEYRVILPDGKLRWIASRGRVELNNAGQPVLVRGLSLDITARKLAELEAQQHRNEVAHLSRVAMLGELSGSLAHELNQPLTAILSNAQAAQRFLARPEIDRAELEAILRDIVEADEHAGEVIRSLRVLLKKGKVQRVPLQANEVVSEVLKLMRSDLLNHHVAVETDLADDLPTVRGDRVQLQQVLLNLVMNASDAMAGSEGLGRRLQVSTGRSAGDGVRVSVRDHGRGIPAEALERVFEPFFTTKPHGLGLGLAVCRSILVAHGGALSVENHPAGGAVFHFTLPGEITSP